MKAYRLVSSRILRLCFLVLAIASAPLAAERPLRRGAEAGTQARGSVKQEGISLERASSIVRQKTGGRILSAKPASRNPQRGYEVRVLVDGKRVRTLFVDSRGNIK